jgi:hypothetical protein
VNRKLTLQEQLSQPVITEMISQRALGWATLGAAGLHIGLVTAGLPGWSCPFRHALGIPCPGCGFSRAVVALWHGDINLSLTYHAFAVPMLLFAGFLILASLLPHHPRDWLITRTANLEHRWAVAATGLTLLFGYWLVRLIFFHSTYIALISN